MAVKLVMIDSRVALRLTNSAGVAVLPDDVSWLDPLIGAADRSLNAPKRGGRNRVMTRAEMAEGFNANFT